MTVRKQTQLTRNRLDAPVLESHPEQAVTLAEALQDVSATPGNFLVRLGIDAASLEIGLALKRARVKAGLKQAELAEQAGVPQGSISEIEHGKGRDGPSYRTIRLLADALGAQIALKPSHSENESDEQSLRALAKDTALVLIDVAGGVLLGSLARALIDEDLMAKLAESARDLGRKTSKQQGAILETHPGALWRLDPHMKAKLSMPKPTLYLVYGGAAKIKATRVISRNVCIAASNERVVLANTGTEAASVLTVPVGALSLAH